ncbi:uncharacterized protein ASPGLDRAFT_1505222 [Aspergillus glaucus CBS 516.65]|uniref:Uncharacterized protein n=1 Tax=Aspergillus glaucus CBS 516.65 TaxID=1160497 RepID=A0A1L9VUX7_ASPGL|nr:hypothetical protein ASPGLDRAFT_1505222 [Aspergillus glaucus CBS 516.65]OJJ87696.1 hypothetical protein ASPGLDRAFT_1505222 [Aspergillus glaucus CBS 516.65]
MNWGPLCDQSLYWLIRSLARFKLFKERTGDIVKLLKFVFEESEYMGNLPASDFARLCSVECGNPYAGRTRFYFALA